MAAPISLRGDFDGPMLRALVLAGKGRERHQAPVLSLVTIYDGGSRADAARLRGRGAADHSRLGPPVQFPGGRMASSTAKSNRASLETQ